MLHSVCAIHGKTDELVRILIELSLIPIGKQLRVARDHTQWLLQVMRGHIGELLEVAVAAGSEVLVGRVFRGRDRTFERRMKQRRWGPLEEICRVCLERAGKHRPRSLRRLRTTARARWPRVKRFTTDGVLS